MSFALCNSSMFKRERERVKTQCNTKCAWKRAQNFKYAQLASAAPTRIQSDGGYTCMHYLHDMHYKFYVTHYRGYN